MTAEETEQLQALGRDLAGATHSAWQPRCIARAFATPTAGNVAFTMQAWIDLDAIKSPLLRGELPENADQLIATALAFGLNLDELEPDEFIDVARGLLRAIQTAFAAALRMDPPQESDEDTSADGFGDWAPLLSFLICEAGLGRSGALTTPVDQAFILLATARRNQGWRVAGTPYAMREAEQ